MSLQNSEGPIEDARVRRVVALLSEALGIIDELGTSPLAGARLDEVITIVRQIQAPPSVSSQVDELTV